MPPGPCSARPSTRRRVRTSTWPPNSWRRWADAPPTMGSPWRSRRSPGGRASTGSRRPGRSSTPPVCPRSGWPWTPSTCSPEATTPPRSPASRGTGWSTSRWPTRRTWRWTCSSGAATIGASRARGRSTWSGSSRRWSRPGTGGRCRSRCSTTSSGRPNPTRRLATQCDRCCSSRSSCGGTGTAAVRAMGIRRAALGPGRWWSCSTRPPSRRARPQPSSRSPRTRGRAQCRTCWCHWDSSWCPARTTRCGRSATVRPAWSSTADRTSSCGGRRLFPARRWPRSGSGSTTRHG